jgi:hypothetical protein
MSVGGPARPIKGATDREVLSVILVRTCVETFAHNLGTEILTILFPPLKEPWIGELSESMRGLTR